MDYIQLVKSRLPAWFLALAAGAVLSANVGCEENSSQPSAPVARPRQFLREIPFPGGTEYLHACGENLVAVSRKSDVYVWEWGDLDKPPLRGTGEGSLTTAFMLPDLIVAKRSSLLEPHDLAYPVLLKKIDSGAELRRWELGPEWYCQKMRTSRSGRFVAIQADRSNGYGIRLGLLDPTSKEPQWVAEIEKEHAVLMASHVAPSEDGRYIAVVGIHDGAWIAVADVEAKKVLWNKRQKGAGGFNDLAFSPDSKTIYAGGTCGGIFAYDVVKGEVTGRWMMGQGKDDEYGYRITCVAASLDGQLVAAGTGSEGDVYLWNVKTDKQVAVFQTRQATIMGMTFSPDSARLAVTGVANRTIEIWDVTQK